MEFRDANNEDFAAEIFELLDLFSSLRIYRVALQEWEISWLEARSLERLRALLQVYCLSLRRCIYDQVWEGVLIGLGILS